MFFCFPFITQKLKIEGSKICESKNFFLFCYIRYDATFYPLFSDILPTFLTLPSDILPTFNAQMWTKYPLFKASFIFCPYISQNLTRMDKKKVIIYKMIDDLYPIKIGSAAFETEQKAKEHIEALCTKFSINNFDGVQAGGIGYKLKIKLI